MASHIITPQAIEKALSGESPALGHPLSATEIGERLAVHRRGRFPGRPFTRQAISLYKRDPTQQSDDFVEAWHSWVAAETTRQVQLRVRMNGMTADEMLTETGYVQQVRDDPVKALIAVGQLSPASLIHVNDVAAVIECTAEIAVCACGRRFVRRSWNSRRCSQCRQGRVKK